MGADTAMSDKHQAEGRAVRGTVVELLPQAAYLVELETHRRIKAHAAGAATANFNRLRPQDRVLVELSPHDPGRGRITKLLE